MPNKEVNSLVIISFKAKCREIHESAIICCSEKQLEETPEEAEGEELPQSSYLFPEPR